MASLAGNAINASCAGLIKTNDNAIVGATEKQITDGLGNAIPMTMGTGGVSFTGGADFTGATVTGLPGGAGLVSGTGADSMQSDASLTTLAADAAGAQSIAIGDGACSTSTGSTAVGDTARALANGAIAVGGTSSGVGVTASGACAVAIGQRMTVSGACAVGIGYRAETTALHGISIGTQAGGNQACSIGIGLSANANASGAVALGANVTAAKADTVSVTELETQLAGGGIYLTTPDGLAQPKLTVDNTCALLVDGSPVGGGGAAGLVSGTGADSMQSADSLTTNPSIVSGANAISLGDNNVADVADLINIGTNLCNSGSGSGGTIMIGKNWRQTSGERSVLIGHNTASVSVGQCGVVAIGSIGSGDSRCAVIIGTGACAYGASNGFGVAVGYNSAAGSGSGTDQATALGYAAKANNLNSLALGASTTASADGATALGQGVTAAKANTVTVKELETCVAGGGITLKSADLTEVKMTATDADVLAVGGDTIPANDSATPTVVNRIWSGSQAQYDALGTYDTNTLYYIA